MTDNEVYDLNEGATLVLLPKPEYGKAKALFLIKTKYTRRDGSDGETPWMDIARAPEVIEKLQELYTKITQEQLLVEHHYPLKDEKEEKSETNKKDK